MSVADRKINPICMPKLGMEMTEGRFTAWSVEEGAEVSRGDELFDVETEKLTTAYEAEFAGVLRKRLAESDTVYPVGRLLGVVAAPDVPDADIDAFVEGFAGAPDDVAPDAPRTQEPDERDAPPAAPAGNGRMSAESVRDFIAQHDLDISPVAARLAAAGGIDLAGVTGTGRLGRISVADVERHTGGALGRRAQPRRASPAAQRLARERGLDLALIRGTGRDGRVLKRDVLSAGAAPAASAADAPPEGAWRAIPLTTMRRAIARRLTQAKNEIPHIYLRTEIHMTTLLAIRDGVNRHLGDRRVSVNAFIVRAAALALRAVPEVNVQFVDDALRRFETADVGVAIALEDGLVSPVIAGACGLGVVAISERVDDLAERARNGRLKPGEIEGGTLTVTNLGMFGITSFDAIINPPQGAILAVGAVAERPANVDGTLKLASTMHATLSCDHRAIDGAVGARYLATLKDLLENPVGLIMAES